MNRWLITIMAGLLTWYCTTGLVSQYKDFCLVQSAMARMAEKSNYGPEPRVADLQENTMPYELELSDRQLDELQSYFCDACSRSDCSGCDQIDPYDVRMWVNDNLPTLVDKLAKHFLGYDKAQEVPELVLTDTEELIKAFLEKTTCFYRR